jgi:predicted amidohydrolase YtcJ
MEVTMKYSSLLLTMIFIFCILAVKADKEIKADLVFKNGKVLKLDDKMGIAEAVAVKGGKVIGVGSSIDINKYIGEETKVFNLEGRLLMPAFVESHAHFYSLGKSLFQLNLVGTESAEEIAMMVKKAADEVPAGQWVLGRGWDQNDWKVKKFPDHVILDKASPENPVILRRIDGHAAWVNGAALQIAEITKDTKDPEGGEILRDAGGNPTGVLIDNAINLVSKLVEKPSPEEKKRYLLSAQVHCFKYGITTFHDMGISTEMLQFLKGLYKEGELKIRLYEMISVENADWKKEAEKGPQIGLFDNRLTVRGVKAFVDGALGSRGALLFEPYSDRPGATGLQVISDEKLVEIAKACKKHNMQLSIHAIGDKGNHKVLDIYEKTIGQDREGKYRWRIEHAQILDPKDIKRFGELGVVPSMQPTHCTSDMPWAGDRLGSERLNGAYAWKSLLDAGVEYIPGGSDAPVESVNPLYGIYAAVTRKDQKGHPGNGWFPGQCLKRKQAIKMFTSWGAWVGFEEDIKGKIEQGYLADFIILDRDITEIPEEKILETKVLKTFLGGEEVYSATK